MSGLPREGCRRIKGVRDSFLSDYVVDVQGYNIVVFDDKLNLIVSFSFVKTAGERGRDTNLRIIV